MSPNVPKIVKAFKADSDELRLNMRLMWKGTLQKISDLRHCNFTTQTHESNVAHGANHPSVLKVLGIVSREHL